MIPLSARSADRCKSVLPKLFAEAADVEWGLELSVVHVLADSKVQVTLHLDSHGLQL